MTTVAAPASEPHAKSIFERYPILTGMGVGVGSLLPHAFLSPRRRLASRRC